MIPTKPTARQTLVLAITIAVVGLIIGLVWQQSTADPADRSAGTAGSTEAIESKPDTGAIHAFDVLTADSAAVSEPEPTVSAPLPPPDLPLAEIYDELAERARRGDADAACRLAAELDRCTTARRYLTAIQRYEEFAANSGLRDSEKESVPPDDSTIAMLASTLERYEPIETLCRGVESERLREAYDFQRIAAERGSPSMRLLYATRPMLDRTYFLDDLDRWHDYREAAPIMLQRALAEGVTGAVPPLALSHVPQSHAPPIPLGVRQPDPDRFMTFQFLSRMLGLDPFRLDPVLDRMTSELDPKRVKNAYTQAEQLRARYFANPQSTMTESPPATSDDPEELCRH